MAFLRLLRVEKVELVLVPSFTPLLMVNFLPTMALITRLVVALTIPIKVLVIKWFLIGLVVLHVVEVVAAIIATIIARAIEPTIIVRAIELIIIVITIKAMPAATD